MFEECRLYKPLQPIEYSISKFIRRPTSTKLFYYLSSKQTPTTTYPYSVLPQHYSCWVFLPKPKRPKESLAKFMFQKNIPKVKMHNDYKCSEPAPTLAKLVTSIILSFAARDTIAVLIKSLKINLQKS